MTSAPFRALWARSPSPSSRCRGDSRARSADRCRGHCRSRSQTGSRAFSGRGGLDDARPERERPRMVEESPAQGASTRSHVRRAPLRMESARRVGRSIFATWEWSEAWWRHFGRGRQLLLHACRSADGRLVSVLPLYVWRERPPRVLRFLGHGPSDEPRPGPPAPSPLVARDLRAALDALDWDVFRAAASRRRGMERGARRCDLAAGGEPRRARTRGRLARVSRRP